MKQFRPYLPSLIVLLLANLGLAVAKITVGYLDASSALRAVGWNNAADFVYTILLGVGLFISFQPADTDHPEGHGRFESLVGLGIALIIITTGLYVIYDALLSALGSPAPVFGWRALALVGLSVVVKAAIGGFLLYESTVLENNVIRAIGYDQAADSLADGAVVGAWLATIYGFPVLDPLIGGVVGGLILYLGFEPLTRHFNDLTGRTPEYDFTPDVESLVDENSFLTEVTSVRAHRVGPGTHLSVTVKAPPNTPLTDVHKAEEALRENLHNLQDVSRAFVHIEPPNVDSPN